MWNQFPLTKRYIVIILLMGIFLLWHATLSAPWKMRKTWSESIDGFEHKNRCYSNFPRGHLAPRVRILLSNIYSAGSMGICNRLRSVCAVCMSSQRLIYTASGVACPAHAPYSARLAVARNQTILSGASCAASAGVRRSWAYFYSAISGRWVSLAWIFQN